MKVHEALGLNEVKEDVGIELEIEGHLPTAIKSRLWDIKQDGSLRGGLEYVTAKPLSVKQAVSALQILDDEFKAFKARPVFSFRTSAHVHLNVTNLDFKELLKVIYLFWMVEPVLIKASGESRRGNRFCLSTQDSDTPIFLMESILERTADYTRRLITTYRRESSKYSAINLASLRSFGTIEVRTMEGNMDIQRLSNWVVLLDRIKNKALSFKTLEDIDSKVTSEGVFPFLEWLMEDLYPYYIYTDADEEVSLQRSLLINILFKSKRFYRANKNSTVHERQQERGPLEGVHFGGIARHDDAMEEARRIWRGIATNGAARAATPAPRPIRWTIDDAIVQDTEADEQHL